MNKWQEFLCRVNPNPVMGKILAIDPGETTGYALFNDAQLVRAGTIITPDDNTWQWTFYNLIVNIQPDIIVMEEYRIYEHKAMDHSYSTIPTLRYIGGIQMIARLRNIDVFMQSANRAKGFCTDVKLKEWEMLQKNNHANDAIRHVTSFYLFSPFAKVS
jgi:hypothetical protein